MDQQMSVTVRVAAASGNSEAAAGNGRLCFVRKHRPFAHEDRNPQLGEHLGGWGGRWRFDDAFERRDGADE